jgi:hypothetical protein
MSIPRIVPSWDPTYLRSWPGFALVVLLALGAPAVSAPGAGEDGADSHPDSVEAPVDPTEVDWRLLSTLDYRSGEASEELTALVGTTVKVPGFIVPLEDWAATVSEFLLVPYFGACVHTPPPPPNQLVYVKMEGGKKAKFEGWNPVWVEGTLRIESTENQYGAAGFRLEGMRVTPYEYPDS